MLTAVVPKNLGHVSDLLISDAIVEMALAARSVCDQRKYNTAGEEDGGGERVQIHDNIIQLNNIINHDHVS